MGKGYGATGHATQCTALADYALDIAGVSISPTWVKHFKACHPDLHVKWTQNLEQYCAWALNHTTLRVFFMLLKELVKKYKIPVENIYNMDKKGIQLSIGACIGAFIDCDQANVYNIKHGSRELVTIIKTVCADGLFLWPSVIYQAMHHDHEWSQNNPCDARYVEYKSLSCYNIFKGFL